MNTSAIILIIFLILCFALILFGLLSTPKLPSIQISPGQGGFNKQCLREKVSCNTDSDCQQQCTEAQEGEEIICQAIPNIPGLTSTQQKILGLNQSTSLSPKYCVPAQAKMDCNVSTGGIPVFTGWGGLDRMEFDCLCAYPLWASSRTCDQNGNCQGYCQLNPGICQGGTFHWDLTKETQEPIAELCECGKGDILIIDNSGLPRCVPGNIQNFYSDLDISTGIQGGQPLLTVDSVPMRLLNPNIPCATGYTSCSGGCCLLPDAVCCPDGGCCPSSYPVCGQGGICLKSNETCSSSETKCSQGCCPISGGVCCSDGIHCCPSNFPVCDITNGTCNPALTPLTSSTSCQGTSCNDGCCPYIDGTCCGDGKTCCPPEYPICDSANGMCRQIEE